MIPRVIFVFKSFSLLTEISSNVARLSLISRTQKIKYISGGILAWVKESAVLLSSIKFSGEEIAKYYVRTRELDV